jgi:cytoplasmic iron level regulating protein YaaA (DUF328/UPF0246 family)
MEERKKSTCHSKKIAFIACSKKKSNVRAKAKNIYQGQLFKKALLYCSFFYDQIYILSAKYGLLSLDDIIDPYEETLNTKTEKQKREWADKVKKQMQQKEIEYELVDIFAGKNYYKYLKYNTVPLADKSGLGYQLQWLNNKIKENIK